MHNHPAVHTPGMTERLPPAVKCTGHVKRDGNRRCRNYAIRGATVCGSHGGKAPQVKAAAARRVALAQAVAAADPRSPGAVLLDTLHVADVLLRRALASTDATATPEALAAVCGHLERAQLFARSVLAAGIEERQTRLAEQVAGAVTSALETVLEALELTEQQEATVRSILPGQLTRLREVIG